MSSQSSKQILLRAYECKNRNKFNLQEFLEIMKIDFETLTLKLSEKGLLIVYLCEMLMKAFTVQRLKFQNFIIEFQRRQLKQKQKREGGGGGGQHRRRKPKQNALRNDPGKSPEDLLEEELSNQSNIQRPRINVENRPQQISGQMPPSKQKSGDESNGSKDSSKNNLKEYLSKVTQQIKGHESTFIQDVDVMPTAFDQNSQNSNSNTSGEISNLSEKIKIFTSTKDQSRTTATRKKTGRNNAVSRDTKTKKKINSIFDESTFLEGSQNDTTIINEISRLEAHDIEDLDITYKFNKMLTVEAPKNISSIFTKQKIDEVRKIILSPKQQFNFPQGNNEQNFYMPSDEDIQNVDYTISHLTSVPVFDQQFLKDSLHLKDSSLNFSEMMSISSKDRSLQFYQLLWREQNDQIILTQHNPQKFSAIHIKIK